MDTKAQFDKIVKDITESAKEFASYGLTVSSKALDFTASSLKSLEAELKKTADKFAPAATPSNDKPADKQ